MSSELSATKDRMMEMRRAAAGGPLPTLAESRAMMDTNFGGLPPIGGAAYADAELGGVRVESITPESPSLAGTLLYFHGGAYCMGSLTSHRRLVTTLCVGAGVRGINVEYRLAPENPFPAGLDDACAAYRSLIGPGGVPPEQVVIGGDSAGGGLALATLVALRDAGDPLPAAALLLSPWTDLTCTAESWSTKAAVEPVLSPDGLRSRVPQYLPDGDPSQPLVSPLRADLRDLPPMLVQVGGEEILYDDSAQLVERAQAAGVTVDFECWPEAFHVFQLLVGVLPEADEALAKASAWIARQLDSGPASAQ